MPDRSAAPRSTGSFCNSTPPPLNRARPLSPRTAAPNRRATTGIRNVVADARVVPSLLPPSPSPHSQRPSPETPAQGRPATIASTTARRSAPASRAARSKPARLPSARHTTGSTALRCCSGRATSIPSPYATGTTAIALLPPAPTPGRPHGLFLLTGMLNAAVPPIATAIAGVLARKVPSRTMPDSRPGDAR